MSIYTYPVIDYRLPEYITSGWYPVLAFGGNSDGITYASVDSACSLLYNTVFFHCYIKLSSKGTNTGNATILGLPELSKNWSGDGRMNFYKNMVSVTAPGGYIEANSGTINLASSTATETVLLTDANFTNTSEFSLSGYYRYLNV